MLLALCSANPSKRKPYTPCKNLVFYYHDIIYNGVNAANATSSIVAARQGANLTKLATQFHFGDIVVFDDPITLDNNLHSTPIGRAQGLYVYDGKNIFTAWFSLALVFNGPHHQGTITLAGADPTLQKTRTLTVTGGTGDFFMHRGIATL
ncbi:disease resistance response protein, partial [Trifolium medium]|nr:disease resistance response protein [Trifolium medium]